MIYTRTNILIFILLVFTENTVADSGRFSFLDFPGGESGDVYDIFYKGDESSQRKAGQAVIERISAAEIALSMNLDNGSGKIHLIYKTEKDNNKIFFMDYSGKYLTKEEQFSGLVKADSMLLKNKILFITYDLKGPRALQITRKSAIEIRIMTDRGLIILKKT
jgi:hypothetical protein